MCECSICLSPVRYTRASKQLECGHLYHGSCIDGWVTAGGDTCPLCRNTMSPVPTYKVKIIVENTRTNQVTEDEVYTEMVIDRFQGELNFEFDTSEEFDEIISSLGFLRGIDVNSLVFDTERTAVL